MAQRIRVGNVEIAVAFDADWRFVPTEFIAGTTPEDWKPYVADPVAEQEARVLTFVVRSQGKNILVDSGVGDWGLWRFGAGHLLDSLRALGLAPEDIDVVLPTHMHTDHIGWNTMPSPNGPVPTFTRAQYLFQQVEWDYFTNPRFLDNEKVRPAAREMVRKAALPLKDTGLMDLIGFEKAVTDEVTLLHTPGHTPGSVTVLVQSAGEAALLIGDAAHHPSEFDRLDWAPAVDVDPSLSSRSRKAIIEQSQRLNALVGGAHLGRGDETAFGRILQIDGRTLWRGVDL